jgi:hypothetical protein
MGKRVIYVNPVKMESEKWDLYQKDTKARLVAGEEINNLVSSLSLTLFFGLSTFFDSSYRFLDIPLFQNFSHSSSFFDLNE